MKGRGPNDYGGAGRQKSQAGRSKPSSSNMSRARWNSLADSTKRKEYGTTSYAKYQQMVSARTSKYNKK
jgi:hypothetical protein